MLALSANYPPWRCQRWPSSPINPRPAPSPPALQVPAIVRMARAALASGKCAVIGLQSTGEARTADVVAEKGEQLDDFVSGESPGCLV